MRATSHAFTVRVIVYSRCMGRTLRCQRLPLLPMSAFGLNGHYGRLDQCPPREARERERRSVPVSVPSPAASGREFPGCDCSASIMVKLIRVTIFLTADTLHH